ncbi:MAG: tRNA pseudouridine(38-40) synthase TruA [Planctomycetes bacterium]|nr:tRNA pseudouridine(38-40) synthase TruA [Planctomycetota bacterium]
MTRKTSTRTRRLLLVVEYDGSGFLGSQRQKNGETVQSALETAMHRLTGEEVRAVFSGRTDSGVHGEGMLVAVDTASTVPDDAFHLALNSHLSPEVAVVSAREVAGDFHPRRAASGKVYRYSILNRPARSPLERRRAWHVQVPLDLPSMREAARRLPGTRDFRCFASEADRKKNTVRTLWAVRVRRERDVIRMDFEGKGFLYNMVRAMAGTLVEVGRGKYPPEWVEEVLDSRDRGRAGQTAPAEGLVLVRVFW